MARFSFTTVIPVVYRPIFIKLGMENRILSEEAMFDNSFLYDTGVNWHAYIQGFDKMECLMEEARVEYEDYRVEHQALREQQRRAEQERQLKNLKSKEEEVKEGGLCSVRKAIRSVLHNLIL